MNGKKLTIVSGLWFLLVWILNITRPIWEDAIWQPVISPNMVVRTIGEIIWVIHRDLQFAFVMLIVGIALWWSQSDNLTTDE